MRTILKTVYLFHELPTEEAKARARDWWTQGIELSWSDESLHSIQTFCSRFGVKLTDWSVGPFSAPTYRTNADNSHFRGQKLRNFSRDNMPTGYCLDCDLWMTFYDQFKATGDAKGAFEEALWAGFKAWRDDMEWQMSDECVDELLTINEYEFDETGARA
jgi:hypothetical protein